MRILIPILAVVLGILFVVAIPALNRNRNDQDTSQRDVKHEVQPEAEPAAHAAADQATVRSTADDAPGSDATSVDPPAVEPRPQADRGSSPPPAAGTTTAADEGQDGVAATLLTKFSGLAPRPVDDTQVSLIGSLEAASEYRLQVGITFVGAGVYLIGLSDYKQDVLEDDPYLVQDLRDQQRGALHLGLMSYPFSVRALNINGTNLALTDARWERLQGSDRADDEASSAVYELTIVEPDAANRPVLSIRRSFWVDLNSQETRVTQELTSHVETPLQIVLDQSAQMDMPLGTTTYMGDQRWVVAGYFNSDYDAKRTHIYADRTFLSRSDVLSEATAGPGTAPIWPRPDLPASAELVWLASVNRYFTVAVHPLLPDDKGARIPSLQETFTVPGVEVHGRAVLNGPDRRVLLYLLRSRSVTLDRRGDTARLDFAFYAGPRKREPFSAEPYKTFQVGDHLIRYSLGGMCTFCTFQWLAKLLLLFMTGIHTVLGDWGLAIIILVLFVRLLLHPITKKSQIQISKFQKQMAAMQPEIEKLKKKYGDNQKKVQQEQMKLFREKGINPMNMLGCLPMFLQMPIWIALYAMLFLAIELRHEPAFYGVFQKIGSLFSETPWLFLADLSASDKFIVFAEGGFNLPVCGTYIPYALNILPILMGVFFFFQTKLTSAPAPTDQARQQQKMMSIMMVTLFPIMLYPAPSGLTLYIMSSSLAGMIDSLVVRKHIKQMEADGTLFASRKPKAGGLIERFQTALNSRRTALATPRPTKRRKPRK